MGKDGKLNWQSLHSNNREMEFGKWMEYCIKTICGVFQIDPLEIGFDISKGSSGQSGGGGGLGNGQQQERIRFSQDKGLKPLLMFIQSMINDYIIYRIDPDFEFRFCGLNMGTDKDELDKQVQQVKSFKTVNEIRAEQDLEPLPDFDKIKNPGDVVLDPSLIQFITGQMQAAQQAQQPMGPDGQPLPPGGAPGSPMDAQPGEEESPMDDEGQGEPEPDYENMSLEELEAELGKLNQAEDGADKKKAVTKSLVKEFEF
jgi:hypothetical protein